MVQLAMDGAAMILVPVTLVLLFAWIVYGLMKYCGALLLRPRWAVAWWRALAVSLVILIACSVSPVRIHVPIHGRALENPVQNVQPSRGLAPNTIAVDTAASSDLPFYPKSEAGLQSWPQASSPSSMLDVSDEYFHPADPGESDYVSSMARSSKLWPITVTMIWLFGVAFGLVRWWLAAAVLRRRVKSSQVVAAATMGRAQVIAAKMGYTGVLHLRLSDIETPCVLGLFKPTILLPHGISSPRRRQDFDVAVAHEVAHMVHRDLIWDAALRLLAILVWFHPWLWFVTKVHRTACERVSDLTAADALGSRDMYASSLARFALAVHSQSTGGVSFGLAVHCDILERLTVLRSSGHAGHLTRSAKLWLGVLPLICAALGIASTTPTVMAEPPQSVQPDSAQVGAAVAQVNVNVAIAQPLQVKDDVGVSSVALTQEHRDTAASLPLASLYDAYRTTPLHVSSNTPKSFLPEVSGQIRRDDRQSVEGVLVVMLALVRQQTPPYIVQAVVARTETNADGQYRFAAASCELPDDFVRIGSSLVRVLAISKDNHFAQIGELLRVSPSSKRVKLDASLRPMVSGSVTYLAPDGSPIPNAAVRVLGLSQLAETPSILTSSSIYPSLPGLITDAEGKCRLPMLPADALVHLTIQHMDWAPTTALGHTAVDRSEDWRKSAIEPRLANAKAQIEKLGQRNDQELLLHYEAEYKSLSAAMQRPLTTLKVTAEPGEVWQGKVVSAEKGLPVPARIEFSRRLALPWPADSAVSTDANGIFQTRRATIPESHRQVKGTAELKVEPLDIDAYLPARVQVDLRALAQLELKVHQAIPIIGQIVASGDQQPLAGLTVSVKSLSVAHYSQSAETDEEGRFQLRAPAGKYQLTASTNVPGIDLPRGPEFPATDFMPQRKQTGSMIYEGVASWDAPASLGAFPVNRTRLIEVRVLDNVGKPASNATVKLHRTAVWSDRNGEMIPSQLMPFSQAVTTNAQGLCQLRPDTSDSFEYLLMATWENNGQVYYGESYHRFLPDGVISIRMQLAQRVTGRVTHNGQPLRDISLKIEELGKMQFPTGASSSNITGGVLQNIDQGTSDSDGNYQFIVPSGKQFRVVALHPARSSQIYLTPKTANGGVASQAIFAFVSGADKLAGKVQMPDGSPVEGASVYLADSSEFNPDLIYDTTRVQSDHEGKFVLDHLPTGRYKVHLFFSSPDRKTSYGGKFDLESGTQDHVLTLKKR